MNQPQVSLVIPIRNEEASIERLIESIARQTFAPDEIVLVDGGSTDQTVEIVEALSKTHPSIKFVKTNGASPGKGRNIGIENAGCEWIALTDAGIELDQKWLAELIATLAARPAADVVFGNYSPVVSNLFEKCAYLCYSPAKRANEISGTSVASMLMRKQVWAKIGGFPDMRAAEDLIFMEAILDGGFSTSAAPKAMVHWQLQPDVLSTLQKFILYSMHNVWAGRQWDWHYGIFKLYLVLMPFFILATVHSWWWLLGLPLWLAARTTKRILAHRYEFGIGTLFNPLIFFGVAGLILVIDLATFVGWIQALGK